MARNDENPLAKQSERMGTNHSKDKPFKELKNVIIQQSEMKRNGEDKMKKNMKKKAWPHFQGRNRDSDIEDGLVDTAGEGEARTNWESSTGIYKCYECIDILYHV